MALEQQAGELCGFSPWARVRWCPAKAPLIWDPHGAGGSVQWGGWSLCRCKSVCRDVEKWVVKAR